MEYIVLGNAGVYFLTGMICAWRGLDLKQWSSWLLGLYGFLSGLAFHFVDWGNPPGPSIETDVQLGLVFAFVVMFTGAINRHYRQMFGEISRNWLLLYGEDERFLNSPVSILIKVMRKLVEE